VASTAILSHDPLRNALFGALPDIDWGRVRRYLHPMETSAGMVLCEPDAHLGHAYFPTTSVISMQRVTVDGASTEVARSVTKVSSASTSSWAMN